LHVLFLIVSRPLMSSPFPYTTLFRSQICCVLRMLVLHIPSCRFGFQPDVDRSAAPQWGSNACNDYAHSELLQFVTNLLTNRFVRDRKSTRLNSSHRTISYAVFCLKKK